jgi:hypothetical protein
MASDNDAANSRIILPPVAAMERAPPGNAFESLARPDAS